MTPADQARLLLRKAQQDQVILQQLLDDPLITDESLGFHGLSGCWTIAEDPSTNNGARAPASQPRPEVHNGIVIGL